MSSGNQLPNLDKILREDEESDFQPSAGSNLAAIFGMQIKPSEASSTKQPVSKKLNVSRNLIQTAQNKTEVIIAKVVHAYKLENRIYTSIGKLGMALTGNAATKVYQIILYKNKQEHVSTVTLSHDFVYVIHPNNYSSYYDNNKENWSILFTSNDICIEFAKEVAFARYFSKIGRIENVLYQDLTPACKDVAAKEGDNIVMKYFVHTDIMQHHKSNPTMLETMTITLSTSDNWEKILLGSYNGLKRILFIPPNKQIGLGHGFPKDKDVVLEMEIIELQKSEEITHSRKVSSGKASIISRMAKMGQSMFVPKLPSTTTDSEDTEDDVPHKTIHQRKAELPEIESLKKHLVQDPKEETSSRNVHRILKPKSDVSVTNAPCKSFVTNTLTPQWSPTQIQPNFITLDGQAYSLQPQTVTPTVSTMMDPGLNILLSETRLTNAELRMGMTKIGDNVQKLLDKFHVLELQNATSPTKDRTDALDTTLKMLLNMNTSFSETKDNRLQTNVDARTADNFAQLNEIKDRVSMLEKELKESKAYVKSLEDQKESIIQAKDNLSKSIKELETSLGNTHTELSMVRKELEESKAVNSKYEEQILVLKNKMPELSEQYSSLEEVPDSMETKELNKNKEIKRIMNSIYHSLLDKFVDESYPTSYIKTVIASTIKNTTLQILNESNERTKKEPESVDAKIIESDNKTNIMESDASDSSTSISKFLQEIEILRETEPPPIPPNDTEYDSDWSRL